MILEVQMGSTGGESLKRPAKYSNCFPLKKRRIKYEEEIVTDLAQNESIASCQLDISEPENLSTKPQDLRISNPENNKEMIPTSPPPRPNNGEIKLQSIPTSHHAINFQNPQHYPPNKELLPGKYTTGPLEPISLNSTNPWSPPGPFVPYSFNPQSLVHSYTKAGEHTRIFKLQSEQHFPHFPPSPLYCPQELMRGPFPEVNVKREVMSPLQMRNIHPELPKGIKKEKLDNSSHPRAPARDSVISHSNSHHYPPHFQFGMTHHHHHHRDNLSRSSYDSGISSPGGSSTGSTISPPSLTPTLVGGSLRYSCPTCQKSYSTVSGLSKHVQFHCATQNPKSFICKDCDKVYTSLGALKMHIRTHTLPCKCNVCGKAFSRPWLLQGHIRTHTGEKPFGCEHCQRAFADRSNLRAHLQTHSELKKYSCKHCAKTFSRMSLLAKHKDTGCSTHSH